MSENLTKIIAVDFDGTIVEHDYPHIGKKMLFAFETLKALQEQGHTLLLWTYREGVYLEKAINFCKENGIEFYAHNENYPGERMENPNTPRKLNADIFIDDRNVGGFIGWSEVWQTLHPNGGPFEHQLKNEAAHKNFKRKRWFF